MRIFGGRGECGRLEECFGRVWALIFVGLWGLLGNWDFSLQRQHISEGKGDFGC